MQGMLRKIESLLFGGRRRADEHAWRVWQEVEPLIPATFPQAERPGTFSEPVRMAGRVVRIYQHARRGSKALVHFGPVLGLQDTWWEHRRPPVDSWVIVQARLWLPPGTHSEQQVFWIDEWESWADGDIRTRALRHQRRMEKEAARHGEAPANEEAPVHPDRDLPQPGSYSPPPAGPLFQARGVAVDAPIARVMATASEIATEMGGTIYGPAEVGGGQHACIWPAVGESTFVSVTARPMFDRGTWVGVSAQSLRSEALNIVDDLSEALKASLGRIELSTQPPERRDDYDRGATKKLEAEIQDLLEAMSADPSAWGPLSVAVYERELLLQHLTELGT